MTGHMGNDGNETADKFARQGSSYPLIGPECALGISAKVARGVIRDLTVRKHEEYWQSIHGQRQAKGFLKRHSGKRAGELLKLSRNQLRLLTGHNHFKEHLFTLGLVDSTGLDRCKQGFGMALCVLYDFIRHWWH
jgi:hypothetical protein